jgi:Protein of unknown function (DUF1592)/Protein of unknown function (DUF1588)/Protein of unknown function (DUF1595)/Protein of unknown function (DUF1587)
MTHTRSSRHVGFGFVLAAAGLFAAGCTGSPGGGGSNGGDSGGNGGDGGNGVVPDPNDGPIEIPECSTKVASAPLRRLTRVEYQNTVKDLLPDVTLPALELAADPVVYGLENNAAELQPTALSVGRAVDVARIIATAARNNLKGQLSCSQGVECGKTFVRTFGARVFRRPVTEPEVETYSKLFSTAGLSFDDALLLTTQALLASPQFLYHFETGSDGGMPDIHWQTANRLSYMLWQTMPDADLTQAAIQKKLGSDADVAAQVERMLESPKASVAFADFTRQWLDFSHLDKFTKLAADKFDDGMRASMRQERQRFMEDIVWKQGGSLKTMLLSRDTFVDKRLADIYGVEINGTDWQRVELPEGERAGFLTQTAHLASHGHPRAPSPVLRGVFAMKNLLCEEVPSPPPGVDATPPNTEGQQLTNRQAYVSLTETGGCANCHRAFNPMGFVFEKYDTMGRYRTMDNGFEVDAVAEIEGKRFDGALEFSADLAENPGVSRCASLFVLRKAFAGATEVEDGCLLDRAHAALQNTDGSLAALLGFIARDPAFIDRRASSLP